MDKIMETFNALLVREEKLFGVKTRSLENHGTNEKIFLGLVYLFCEYSIIRKTVIELYTDVRMGENEILLIQDVFQIVSVRLIELLPMVSKVKQSLWLRVFSKINRTQDDIKFVTPVHLIDNTRLDELSRRNKIINVITVMEQKAKTDFMKTDSDTVDSDNENDKNSLAFEAAAILIQTSERRRQAMIRGESLRKLRSKNSMTRFRSKLKYTPDEAARILQKAFRGWMFRKRFNRLRQMELNLLGLGTVLSETRTSSSSSTYYERKHKERETNQTNSNNKFQQQQNNSKQKHTIKPIAIRDSIGSKFYVELKKLSVNYTEYKKTKLYETICRRKARPQIPMINDHKYCYTIYKELIAANVVSAVKNVNLDDLVSQKVKIKVRSKRFETDLAAALNAYCFSPLYFSYISHKFPKIYSMLLSGPIGSGKTSFVEALAYNSGSNLFRFTPRCLKGGGKASQGLMLTLRRFVRKDGPSIIWFDKVGRSLKLGLKTSVKVWIQNWTKVAKSSDGIFVIATSDVSNVTTKIFSITIEFQSSSEEARFEIIKRTLLEATKSWQLPEDAIQLSLFTDLTMATENLQLGTIVTALRSAMHESLRQKLKNADRRLTLADFLPFIQSCRFLKKTQQ